jgi:mono/diheme cytochrome c family protein
LFEGSITDMPAKEATHKLAARRNLLVGAAVLLVGGALAWWLMPGATSTTVDVKVPELSPVAEAGRVAFREHCAACHGPAAGGTDKGPPLVHKWYQPNLHADVSFVLAAKRGAPQHHWPFGNMPPVPDVDDQSLQQIIRYVRELQRANGIY